MLLADMFKEVKKTFKQESSKAIIPAAFLAFAFLDVIPTPTDIGYFYVEKYLKDHPDIPNYWVYQALNYYGWDVLWYLSLFGITYFAGKTVWNKVGLGVGVVSAGALAWLLWRLSTPVSTAEAPNANIPIVPYE